MVVVVWFLSVRSVLPVGQPADCCWRLMRECSRMRGPAFSWPRPGLEAIAGRFIQLIKLLLGAGLIFFEYLQRDSVILKLKERCKQLTNTLINLFLPKAWNQKERDNLFFPVQLQKFNLINLIKTISTTSENESSWRSLDTIYTVTEIHFFW